MLENKINTVLALLGFCMLTDFLDGFAARYRDEQSRLGSILDPLADKLLISSVFLTLATLDLIDMWVFVVFFSRDLLIVLGWLIIFILTGSSKIENRKTGKITTAIQMGTALAIIWGTTHQIQTGIIWLSVLFTIASTIEYVIVGEKRLGEWG